MKIKSLVLLCAVVLLVSCDPPYVLPHKAMSVVVAASLGRSLEAAEPYIKQENFKLVEKDQSQVIYTRTEGGKTEHMALLLSPDKIIMSAYARRVDDHLDVALNHYRFNSYFAWNERLPKAGLWSAVVAYTSGEEQEFMVTRGGEGIPETNGGEPDAEVISREEFDKAIASNDPKYESIVEIYYQSALGMAGALPRRTSYNPFYVSDTLLVTPTRINVTFSVEDEGYVTTYSEMISGKDRQEN